MIISVCGMDGAGKTTLCNNLIKILNSNGIQSRYFKMNPFYGYGYCYFKNILKMAFEDDLSTYKNTFQLLMTMETIKIIKEQIQNFSNKHNNIFFICDRYLETMEAWLDTNNYPKNEYLKAIEQLPKADMTILLDIDFEKACERIRLRGDIVEESSKGNMVEIIKRLKNNEGITMIDASQNINSVTKQAFVLIKNKVKLLNDKHSNIDGKFNNTIINNLYGESNVL